jgi:uncharacterized OsmC-like protein
MGIAARKLAIDLKGMTAEVEKEMTVTGSRRISKVVVRIRSSFIPNGQMQEKLEKAAMDCPVSLSLHPSVRVEADFVWGL